MRFKRIKKEIDQYFNEKIVEQKLPIGINTIYETGQVDKFPKRKTAWFKQPVPVFGILVLIVFSGYMILTSIFQSSPNTNDLERLQKIFSRMPQFQKNLHHAVNGGEQAAVNDNDTFMLEMTIKNALFLIHRERLANTDLTILFNRVIFQPSAAKEEETMIYPGWEKSRLQGLENRIKKMIAEKQVYRSLKAINKS